MEGGKPVNERPEWIRQLPTGDCRPRILVRGVNWLGDAVMTTPALQRLREAFPDAHIALACRHHLASLWREYDGVDEVIPIPAKSSAWAFGRSIRHRRFELGLALPNSPRTAMELFFAGIPHRVGMSRGWANLFLNHPVTPREGVHGMSKRSPSEIRERLRTVPPPSEPGYRYEDHHLHHYLHLVASLGCSHIPLPPRLQVHRDEVADVFSRFQLQSEGPAWIAVAPGAEYGPAKRWPTERFAEALLQAHERHPLRILLVGGPGDRDRAEELAGKLAVQGVDASPTTVITAGQTDLREACAILKGVRLLLTNDSGPMHVAAALGTPVVAVFGGTSPELTGPGLPGDPLHALVRNPPACAPCFQRDCPIDLRCLRDIPTETVVREILRRLGHAESKV